MDWIKLLPHEEGIGKIGKEAVSCFVLLFWPYMVVMWALSKGMVVDPREFFGGITHPRVIIEAFTAVALVLVVRRLRGDKPSPYRYGWILTAIGMFLFPFVSLTRSQLVGSDAVFHTVVLPRHLDVFMGSGSGEGKENLLK